LLTHRLLTRGGEGVADERAVAVDARELSQDGLLQLLARDTLAATGFGAVLLAGGACVVVVEAAFAARGHADVSAAALPAANHAGEQEVRGIAAATGDIVSALCEERLSLVERRAVDQRLVR
jgi:hypothetical protein